jgi:DNA-binding CsgD family transcriptional regulator
MFALLLFVFLARKISLFIMRPAFLFGVFALATVGSGFMEMDFFFPAIASTTIPIGTMLTAFSAGAMLALWGEAYARIRDVTFQAVATFAGLAASFLLYLLIVSFPKAASVVIVILLPLALLVCFWRIFRSDPSTGEEGPTAHSPIKSFPKLLVYILAFSVPLSFLETLLLSNADIAQGAWVLVYALTLVILTAIVLIEYLIRKSQFSIFLIAIILFVTICLLFFFLYDTSALIMRVFMSAGYYLFLVSFYSFLGSYILKSDGPPFRIFALGNCANTLGFVLGWGIGLIVEQFFSSLAAGLAVAIVYMLFFVGLFVMPTIKVSFFTTEEQEEVLDEQPASNTNLMDDIQIQCGLATAEFSLSPREEEILNYLMRARNLPSIAKEMIVSENTVKTHVNHIYGKIGVHKREDLVAKVERLRP